MILAGVCLLHLSLSYFWHRCLRLILSNYKCFFIPYWCTNALTYTSPKIRTTATRFIFFYTRRYNFNSFMFFFAAGLPQLPNFREVHTFRLRYGTLRINHKRLNLLILSLLNYYPPLVDYLATQRLSVNVILNNTNFRRPNRVFFFKRNLHHVRAQVLRSRTLNLQAKPIIKITRSALVTSQLWTQSSFKTTPALHTHNTTPFFFLPTVTEPHHTYITSWLREFKSKVTRFMKLDFKKTVIQYNLKPMYTRDLWLLGNRTPTQLVHNVWSYNFFGFSPFMAYPLELCSNLSTSFRVNDLRKSYLYRLRTRRMLTLWVSKVTQRTLTPVRREFNSLYFQKPLRYQHRLTALILRYYRFRVIEFINTLEFSFINVVMRSRFITLRPTALDFISRRWFLINGIVTTDPALLISPLDVIHLTPSLLWLFFYKWLLLQVREYFGRFFYYLRKWRIRANRPYPKQSSFRTPEWVRKKLFFRETAPIFFEIDFLTFSCVNIFNPLVHTSNYHYLSINTYAPATIRPLNWKSLT
uniref:ribosomal protein S4 n=1 Tax=Euplotes vannus TaxID=5939 RepID=UPI002E78EFFC|nr:ribosomal protein S4 [Euplotes vannus]UPM52110.1 ribosomal protein S4 [Euplotes vannus]